VKKSLAEFEQNVEHVMKVGGGELFNYLLQSLGVVGS
jgi:hypothetical protein